MSTFLKTSGPDGAKLFCLRDPVTDIGFDETGRLACGYQVKPLVRVVSAADCCRIISCAVDCKAGGLAEDDIILHAGQCATFESPSYSILFAQTSGSSELLARAGAAENSPGELSTFEVSYSLAGIEKRFQLPFGADVWLGSGEQDAIYLPIDGIRSHHLRLCAGKSLEFDPLGKPVCIDGCSTSQKMIIRPPGCSLELLPTKLALQISALNSRPNS